jgi:hypothetical protein
MDMSVKSRHLVNQVLNLHVISTRCCIGDGPRTLLADVEVFRLEHLDELGDDVVVDNSLTHATSLSKDSATSTTKVFCSFEFGHGGLGCRTSSYLELILAACCDV